MQQSQIFSAADILLPQQCDYSKWAVVACDQYTSQPDYWQRVQRETEGALSTYHLMLPEIYLEEPDVQTRVQTIHREMKRCLDGGMLRELPAHFVYVERTLSGTGAVRRGLVGKIDLEAYSYTAGAKSPVRPTEGTIESRLPPRMAVRQEAPLELPHIMVFVDDPQRLLIEPLGDMTGTMECLYDFVLMEQSGQIRGYAVGGEAAEQVAVTLKTLEQKSEEERDPLLFAVGDGNHSLATAKACWERLKADLTPEQQAEHPARYALVELVNLHDETIEFEPIHRVLFDVDPAHVASAFAARYAATEGSEALVEISSHGKSTQFASSEIRMTNAVAAVQAFLDEYLAAHGGRIDYIHGDDTARTLAEGEKAIAFLLPPMEKALLFSSVQENGVLPRKTFSIGHAQDKRFYLECRRIR